MVGNVVDINHGKYPQKNSPNRRENHKKSRKMHSRKRITRGKEVEGNYSNNNNNNSANIAGSRGKLTKGRLNTPKSSYGSYGNGILSAEAVCMCVCVL